MMAPERPESALPGLRLALPAGLALLAGGLFAAGLLLDGGAGPSPRLAAFPVDVRVDGRTARAGQRIQPGAVVTTGRSGSATLLVGGRGEVVLGEEGALVYRGRLRGGRAFRLVCGRVLARPRGDAEGLDLATDLGGVRADGSCAFELYVAPVLPGRASITPRTLRLAVGEGRAGFERALEGAGLQEVPAGVALRAAEWDPRVRCETLLAAEWERLTGRVPAFADAQLAFEKIPPGVWVPRAPGRNGPVPGSRTRVRLNYSAELRGLALSGGPADGAPWLYDAQADRWGRTEPATPSPAPAGEGHVARDAARDLALRFGGEAADSVGCGTWLRRGVGRWERLNPAASPPPRKNHAVGYDPAADLFVVYGGEAPGTVHDDAWVFRLPR